MDLALSYPASLESGAWASIESYRARLAMALTGNDHALVIGTVKDLVEATAKVVLDVRGETVPSNEKFGTIVQRAQSVLGRQPGVGLAGGPPIRFTANPGSSMEMTVGRPALSPRPVDQGGPPRNG